MSHFFICWNHQISLVYFYSVYPKTMSRKNNFHKGKQVPPQGNHPPGPSFYKYSMWKHHTHNLCIQSILVYLSVNTNGKREIGEWIQAKMKQNSLRGWRIWNKGSLPCKMLAVIFKILPDKPVNSNGPCCRENFKLVQCPPHYKISNNLNTKENPYSIRSDSLKLMSFLGSN